MPLRATLQAELSSAEVAALVREYHTGAGTAARNCAAELAAQRRFDEAEKMFAEATHFFGSVQGSEGAATRHATLVGRDNNRLAIAMAARKEGQAYAAVQAYSAAEACHQKSLLHLEEISTIDVGDEIQLSAALQAALMHLQGHDMSAYFATRLPTPANVAPEGRQCAWQTAMICYAIRMHRADLVGARNALDVVKQLSGDSMTHDYTLIENAYRQELLKLA